jgi:hypothetical protein
MLRFPKAPWQDALSHVQMQSKAWAVDELTKARKNLGLVYVVGGRFGLLGPLLFAEPKLKIKKVRSFDIDPDCEQIADQVNIEKVIFEWQYKAVTKDMLKIDYQKHDYEIQPPGGWFDENKKFVRNKPVRMIESPDVVINTSCNRLREFTKWWSIIPPGKLTLLQNNDHHGGDDHVNALSTVQQMADQAPMSKVMFSGERDYAKFKRFMIIGIK